MNSVVQLLVPPRVTLATVTPCPQSLLQTYQDHGGAVTGDQMVGRMLNHWPQPLSRLARWIVERRVIHFHCHGSLYLPLFQFDLARAAPRSVVQRVVALLPRAFDDEEVAEWFAQPSCLLAGEMPASALRDRPDAVAQAAQAMRFLCQ